MNLEKYKNDGWGLSKKCFEDIISIFNIHEIKNVVEFGSGVSTFFFVDLMINNDFNLLSYDDNLEFAAKISHPNLKLKIVSLVETSDNSYENMFKEKQIKKTLFYDKLTPVSTRQKNTFYYVNEDDLPNEIDLMVVDGPHGNGRNIAFLYGIGRLKSGSFVVIDDYNHYDFTDKFISLFSNVKIISESNTGPSNQWELGGNYIIYEIL